MSKLTYERLHEVLDYNSDTGVFVWKEILMKDGKRDYQQHKNISKITLNFKKGN